MPATPFSFSYSRMGSDVVDLFPANEFQKEIVYERSSSCVCS